MCVCDNAVCDRVACDRIVCGTVVCVRACDRVACDRVVGRRTGGGRGGEVDGFRAEKQEPHTYKLPTQHEQLKAKSLHAWRIWTSLFLCASFAPLFIIAMGSVSMINPAQHPRFWEPPGSLWQQAMNSTGTCYSSACFCRMRVAKPYQIALPTQM